MKKVLATLLAVLLLMCVFGTVASAADAPWPKEDPDNYEYGHSTVLVPTDGKTTVKDDVEIQLDMSSVDKPDNGEIERYLNDRYVAKPPEFTVRCVNPFHIHAITDDGDLPLCEKGWVKSSNRDYTCDGGYWKVIENNGHVVKAQWQCPYQGTHPIYAIVTYKAPHTHVFEEKVKAKAYDATCTEPAKYYKICECGATSQDTFEVGEKDPNNHPVDKLVENQDCCESHEDSNCTKHGTRCTACGHFVESTLVGHTFGDWETVTEATETMDGLKKRTCVCGHFETDTIPATGHIHVKGTKHDALPGTCIAKGTIEYYECTGCNAKLDAQGNVLESIEGEYGPHNFIRTYPHVDFLKSEATCTEPAVYFKSCMLCGATSEGTDHEDTFTSGEALGHDFVRTYPHVDYLEAAATCTTPAKYYVSCNRPGCGASSKGEIGEATFPYGDPLGHDLGGWVYDDDTHWKKCSRCDYTEQEAAHTYGAGVVSKMPTCWSKGEVKYTCTVCDHSYTKELPALGHYFETVTIESTCTGEGYTAQKCIRCGLIVSQGVLDPAGHKPGDWEVTKAATCTEKGQEVKTCTVCGVVVEMREIDALGHDWGEWETVKEPTTEAEGEEKRVCKRDATHVETRPIAKLEPTPAPTEEPTVEPTVEPTAEPTMAPTAEPTAEPTAQPTVEPTKKPDKTDIPKTGDNSHFGYAYLMIAVAAAGLVVLAATRRKEGSK